MEIDGHGQPRSNEVALSRMLNIIGLTIPVSIAIGRITEKRGTPGFDVRPVMRIYTMPPFRRLINTTPPILTRGGLNANLFARR